MAGLDLIAALPGKTDCGAGGEGRGVKGEVLWSGLRQGSVFGARVRGSDQVFGAVPREPRPAGGMTPALALAPCDRVGVGSSLGTRGFDS